MKIFFAIILASILVACASTGPQEMKKGEQEHKHGRFTQHLADSKLLVTEKGMFSVEMSIPDNRLKLG